MSAVRSGIYGLTDESRQAVCYVGRAFDVDQRYKQHITEGRTRLREALGRGWLERPIMKGRRNWLAYMLLTGKGIGLVLLEPVERDVLKQSDRELAWALELREQGVPLANGTLAGLSMGSYLEKGQCPYSPDLPVARAESIAPPDGLLHLPYWGEVIPTASLPR